MSMNTLRFQLGAWKPNSCWLEGKVLYKLIIKIKYYYGLNVCVPQPNSYVVALTPTMVVLGGKVWGG